MQRGYHGILHFPEQPRQIAPRGPVEDPELVLKGKHIGVSQIQRIRGPPVGTCVSFLKLEANTAAIGVGLQRVGYSDYETIRFGGGGRNRLVEIGGKSGDATATGCVSSEESKITEGWGQA